MSILIQQQNIRLFNNYYVYIVRMIQRLANMHLTARLIKSVFTGICLCILFLGGNNPAYASTDHKLFIDSVDAYNSGQYDEAVSGFKALTDRGVKNPKLFYNLGNAYFKNNDLGPAIYWYERAKKLMLGDPDLTFNLSHAREKVADAVASDTTSFMDYLFFWKDSVGRRHMAVVALTMNAFFWGWVILSIFMKKTWIRFGVLTSGIIASVTIATAGYQYFSDTWIETGIVLPQALEVKAGTTDGATVLFRLHAGTAVCIEKKRHESYLIRLDDDKIGWVEKDAIGIL